MVGILDSLRKKLGQFGDQKEAPEENELPPERNLRADPDDVLRELGSTADSRTDAETLIAEATYNLKRGNREKTPEKKLEFFRQALTRFERLHQLLPGERTIQEQVAKLSKGIEEIEAVILRYAEGKGGNEP